MHGLLQLVRDFLEPSVAGDIWIKNSLTGVRLSLICLYLMLLWRTAFYSWNITEQAPEIRKRGWKWFRFGLVILSLSVILFYSPENILRVNGYITQTTGHMMMLAGSFMNLATAVSLLVGLDIAGGRTARALPVYVAIAAVSMAWVFIR